MTVIYGLFVFLFFIFLKICNLKISDYTNSVIKIKEKTFNKNNNSKLTKKNIKQKKKE